MPENLRGVENAVVAMIADRLAWNAIAATGAIDDIVDFDFEKSREDPRNRQTWAYRAQFRKYTIEYVRGPKGFVSVG